MGGSADSGRRFLTHANRRLTKPPIILIPKRERTGRESFQARATEPHLKPPFS